MKDNSVLNWPADIEKGKKMNRFKSYLADGIHCLETRSERRRSVAGGRDSQRNSVSSLEKWAASGVIHRLWDAGNEEKTNAGGGRDFRGI